LGASCFSCDAADRVFSKPKRDLAFPPIGPDYDCANPSNDKDCHRSKCTINFESIEIQNKKSDSDHADNDWLSIVFYANEGEVYRDTISLRNLGGSQLVLEAASADFGGQVGAGIAQLIAPFYDLLEKKIVELVGITFDKVIAPIVAAIAGEVANLLGHPDCNGEVMRDVATFWPGVVNDESYSKTYEGSQKNSYCGMAPHTKIDLHKYRELDLFVGEFGPVIQPDQNELAIREFQQRARVAVQEGFVGGFPHFYYASYGPRNVGQTIFLRHRCAELHNVDSLLLGEPDQNDFAEMMRAANDYALRHGFVGGFPTFLADQEVSISRSENRCRDSLLAPARMRVAGHASTPHASYRGPIRTCVCRLIKELSAVSS